MMQNPKPVAMVWINVKGKRIKRHQNRLLNKDTIKSQRVLARHCGPLNCNWLEPFLRAGWRRLTVLCRRGLRSGS